MDKQLRVYISGPMDTFENFNYDIFDQVAQDLRENFGCEVFSPADYGREQLGGEDSSKQQLPAVRRALLAGELSWICMSADLVLMLPGWQHSLGARARTGYCLRS